MPAAIRVSPEVARRFHSRALLLDRPVATVGEALAHLGYVQMDPINVCGRLADLTLRNLPSEIHNTILTLLRVETAG